MEISRIARKAFARLPPFSEDPKLLEAAIELLDVSRSSSTFDGWDLASRRYEKYCDTCKIPMNDRWPPTSAGSLGFVAYMFKYINLTCGVAKTHVGAIKSICRFLNLPTEGMENPQIEFALASYGRLKPSRKKKKRLPITTAILAEFHECITGVPVMTTALKAITSGMLYALLRPEDATPVRTMKKKRKRKKEGLPLHPLRSHITWHPDHFELFLPTSKTDTANEGRIIKVYANSTSTCPWILLRRHWNVAPSQRPEDPLYQDSEGKPITYDYLHKMTRGMARAAGAKEPLMYLPHSYRIGGATSLAMAGVPASIIKEMGRWNSVCYQTYIRTHGSQLQTASHAMASIPSITGSSVDSPMAYGGKLPSSLAQVDFENIEVIFN